MTESEQEHKSHFPGKSWDSMSAYETEILQRLAVLVVFHGLGQGQVLSQYFLVQSPLPWFKAREFCQTHYVDLAVLSTEEQYFTLLNATAPMEVTLWLGLQRRSHSSSWKWVDEEDLRYGHWYRNNYDCLCAGLETMLKTDKKLLARYCEELHASVCQGPAAPQTVMVEPGSDHLILSWNVSAFMQMTPHSYNVTICNDTCDSLIYAYTDGPAVLNITISNLTSATEYFIEISAFVVRSAVTGGEIILQSDSTLLKVRTDNGKGQMNLLKLLRVLFMAPVLWVLYHVCKKYAHDEVVHVISLEVSTEGTTVDLIPRKIRAVG